MRTRATRWPGVLALLCALALCAETGAMPFRAQKSDARNVNPDAAVLVDFNRRIKQYLDLRKPLKEATPPLKETKEPARITAAQEGLAQKLREARRDARAGDILTPDIRRAFRRLLYPEVTGSEGRATRSTLKEDAPDHVRLKVNATYPETAPLPTVPPKILANLPPLPEELEYRIIEKHLILRDTQANIIVDFMPNAIQ